MGLTADEERLARGLARLADDAPTASVPARGALVRQRAGVARRRRAAAVVAAAAVVLVPLPGLLPDLLPGLLPGAGPAPLAAATTDRVVATFAFPDQGAVAELLAPEDAAVGETVRLVVRVRSERGRVGGVDLVWGDGRAQWLDGGARCTPGAGPTVVELSAEHVFSAAGTYVVRAAPQVLSGCRSGTGRFSGERTQPDEARVQVR